MAEQVVRDAAVVAEDERETFIGWIKTTHRPESNAWWRMVAANNDFPDLAVQWRAQHNPTRAALPHWCGHCGADTPGARVNPRFRLLDGDLCPNCHPDVLRSNAS